MIALPLLVAQTSTSGRNAEIEILSWLPSFGTPITLIGQSSSLMDLLRTSYGGSTMAGKPYRVGRFAHTLRVRLMREHLGVDVDSLPEEDIMGSDPIDPERDQKVRDPETEHERGQDGGTTQIKKTTIHKAPIEGDIDMVKDGASQGYTSVIPIDKLKHIAQLCKMQLMRQQANFCSM